MTNPKILIFSGSTRVDSVNTRLAKVIAQEFLGSGAEAQRVCLSDYEMPLYNGDLEGEQGVPENAKRLGELISQSDAVVMVSPEYNGSMSPLLKNTLDWMSRDLGEVKPYQKAVFALAACSPGGLGGIRGVNHVRDVLVSLGAEVLSPQLCVGPASQSFDDDGNLTQDRHKSILQKLCGALIERTER